MIIFSPKVLRIIFVMGLALLPVIFGWWLFVPLLLLFVALARRAYEPIIVGGILDSIYYFGDQFWQSHLLILLGLIGTALSLFFENRVNWRKLL